MDKTNRLLIILIFACLVGVHAGIAGPLFEQTCEDAKLERRFNLDLTSGGPAGAGSCGVLYKGIDLETGQPVAIKYARPDFKKEQMRESQVLKSLNNDRIPKYIASFMCSNGTHILVEGWVEGEVLQQRLSRQPALSTYEITKITRDLIYILHYMHERGVGHLDLHPGNLIINENNELFLIDFGEARSGLEPNKGLHGGDLHYLHFADPDFRKSPAHSLYGLAVDYYGVALILYKMTLHKRAKLMKNANAGDPEFRTGLPPVDALMEILTDRNQNKRWKNCFENISTMMNMSFFSQKTDIVPNAVNRCGKEETPGDAALHTAEGAPVLCRNINTILRWKGNLRDVFLGPICLCLYILVPLGTVFLILALVYSKKRQTF